MIGLDTHSETWRKPEKVEIFADFPAVQLSHLVVLLLVLSSWDGHLV